MKTKISFQDSHAEILVNSAHGIFIPQTFIEWFEPYIVWPDDKDIQQILDDLKSPENEFYWDSWDWILGNCKITDDDGKMFFLFQYEDVWAIPVDEMELIDWDEF